MISKMSFNYRGMKFRFEEPAPFGGEAGDVFQLIPFRDDSEYQIPPLKGDSIKAAFKIIFLYCIQVQNLLFKTVALQFSIFFPDTFIKY